MIEGKHPSRVARSVFLRSVARGASGGAAGAEVLTLRIDAPSPGRAFAKGPSAEATHLERAVPERVRPHLPAIARAIAEASSVELAARRATELLEGSGLSVDRRDEPARLLRRHPAGRLRPSAERPLVDAELLGLELGARAVAKRMCPPGGAGDRVARLRELGLEVTHFGVTTHGTSTSSLREVILVAVDPSALREARQVEEALVRAADERLDDAEAVRAMGVLLGYPRCCVERFVLLRARDDASLAGALLPSIGERAPFETAFTVPPFTLISHAPCSPRCAATLSLVGRLLDAMPAPSRAFYVALSEHGWGVDEEGLLLRARAASESAPAELVQIDLTDPELTERTLPLGSSLEELDAHWRIETFSARSVGEGAALSSEAPPTGA